VSGQPEQLVPDLPHRAAIEAEDFLVSEANAAAIAVVDRWPDWQHWAVVVVGPEGSGKSHLANVWRSRSGAGRVEAAQFGEQRFVVVERCGAFFVLAADERHALIFNGAPLSDLVWPVAGIALGGKFPLPAGRPYTR